MTVAELMEILKEIENPETSEIVVKDSAAGFRDIDYFEDSLDSGNYVMHLKKIKKSGK